jgi:glutathione synthase/RimK-type ligase-like ATP-grasp enzyme
MYVCFSPQEVDEAVRICEEVSNSFYISELIPKTHEYRVHVAQGRVVSVMEKTVDDPNQVAWNWCKGGKFTYVKWGEWNMPMVKAAILAHNISGLDFSGVDVIYDEVVDKAYVLEINSAPSLAEYDSTCMAKCLDWMIGGIRNFPNKWVKKERLKLGPPDMHSEWRSYIHPAISSKAYDDKGQSFEAE